MSPDPTPEAPAQDHDSDDSRWRLAVLGLGRRGLEHAAAIARDAGCVLAGLVDARSDLRAFARGCGFQAPIVATLPKLLERGALDGVVLCTPARETPEALARAAQAGLAVLVPGLPASDAEGRAAFLSAAAAAPRPVVSGQAVLTHPLFARAEQLLRGDSLGGLLSIRASVQVSRVFGPSSAPPAGDVLEHVAFDLVVLLDRLFGPALAASARGQRLYGAGLDEANIQLTRAAEPPITFDCSWSAPGYPRAALVVEVEYERGRVLASDDALEIEEEGGHEPRRVVLAGLEEGQAFEWGEAHAALQAFTQRLAHGMSADDPLSMARACRAVAVLAAVRGSAAASGLPVAVVS